MKTKTRVVEFAVEVRVDGEKTLQLTVDLPSDKPVWAERLVADAMARARQIAMAQLQDVRR